MGIGTERKRLDIDGEVIMDLDEKQIAFITCVNDETEYAECRFYLDRLYIPDGYSTDVISIQGAPSMAAGYNAGMKSSAARYKVYLHQDVFIKNRDFIADMLAIFAYDEKIGMIGMVGRREMGNDVDMLTDWDSGKLTDNLAPLDFRSPGQEEVFVKVQTADGCILITRYDIPWREDIFDGWDLYDHSQCMEFYRAGYKVVVPWQKEGWCYHDCGYPKLMRYHALYERFVKEYPEVGGLSMIKGSPDRSEREQEEKHAQLIEELRKMIVHLLDTGKKRELRGLFGRPQVRELIYLREYGSIVYIDQQEEQEQSAFCFWVEGMTADQLLLKLRQLKYALKRIEYGADDTGIEFIQKNYSKYAICDVCGHYVADRENVYKKMGMIVR